jgi:predicted small secreted protein
MAAQGEDEDFVMMNRLFALGLLALLSACNTIEGAGRDLSSVGKAVAKSADDNK